jgi:hypothetical protein
MNKEAILAEKRAQISLLHSEMNSISQIELGRLYMIKELERYDERYYESYGFFECFNRDSVRFNVIASDFPKYQDSAYRRMRGNINSYAYNGLFERLTRVKKDDLPLLVGLRYASVDLEKILKGKKRIKIDG